MLLLLSSGKTLNGTQFLSFFPFGLHSMVVRRDQVQTVENREAFSLFYNKMGSLCSMNIMASNFQKAITNVKTAYYKPLCRAL